MGEIKPARGNQKCKLGIRPSTRYLQETATGLSTREAVL